MKMKMRKIKSEQKSKVKFLELIDRMGTGKFI